MGKYVRKGKVSGEVAVMEVASHLGVLTRTRARSLLALHKQPSLEDEKGSSSSSYLELRSRRLEKPTPKQSLKDCCSKRRSMKEASPDVDGGVEVSFGENVLEIEARDSFRDARETTPCSLIRDPESVGTPGSTTRPTNSATSNRRMQNSMCQNIPTANEMEEFFAVAEQLQQRIFTEKYNFDPVNDQPLPGRYEWVKLGC